MIYRIRFRYVDGETSVRDLMHSQLPAERFSFEAFLDGQNIVLSDGTEIKLCRMV